MMVVVLLLALVGSCWGLQPKLEYQYRYHGRVASGIPSIKRQFSGAGIQADVTVQLTQAPVILVQISNVHVGDFHDEIKCDFRAPLPIEYHRLVEGADQLEKPFLVHLNDTEDADYMEAPVEPAWITNIRRSIVNIFRVAPLRVNFGIRGQEFQRPTFVVAETTISGHCRNWYSLLRLPKEEAARENKEREATIEDDIQRDQEPDSSSYTKVGSKKGKTSPPKGKTSHGKGPSKVSEPGRLRDVPTLDDALWTMVRTVDFNSCEDLVALKLHGHKKTDEKISRSSVGTYLLRGDEIGWRIERAVVEGSVSVFADAEGQNHVDTFTNQTLELRAVRLLREELQIDYEPHHCHSWHYKVDHRLPDTMEDLETHPSLEQVVTGVTLTHDTISQAQNFIIELLQTTVSHLSTTPHPTAPVSREIGKIADAVALLSRQEIDALVGLVPLGDPSYDLKINILYKAFIVAGTGPSITCLIENMGDQSFRRGHSDILFQLLFDGENNMKNPLIIPKITELVMAMTWDGVDEYLKPIGLMTVAKLANKLCLNSGRRETFGSNTCDPHHVCNTGLIIDVLLPALIQGVQDEEAPVWKRVVYLQALSNLGAPQAIAALKHIILGDTESHIGLRINAILSMSTLHMPRTVYHTVFNLLMPIYENLGEHHEVRNIAFLVMSTWEPRISWWQRVAVSTWREPSSQVASLVSTAITSLARGKEPVSKSASRVVHLLKPASSHLLTQSSMTYLNEYLYNCELKSKISFAWLSSTQSLFPTDVLLRIQHHTITGLPLDSTILLHQKALDDILKIVWRYRSATGDTKQGDSFDIVNDMFEQVKEQLGVHPPSKEPELSLWLKLQQIYITSRTVIFNEGRTSFSPDMSFYEHFHSKLYVPEFWRDVDSTIALPTDIGLPILVKYAEQSAYFMKMVHNEPALSTGPMKIKISVTVKNDFSTNSILEAKTLLPWSQNFAVGAGVHNDFSMLLPLSVHGSLDLTRKVLQFTVEPLTPDPVEILSSYNHPYTVLAGPFPTVLHSERHRYKIVFVSDTQLYSRHTRPLPSVVGLEVESIWSGDIEFPLNSQSFLGETLSLVVPSYKAWDYRIVFHPESSVTKGITITMTYETLKKSASLVEEQSFQDLGQETQGRGELPDFSSLSQTSSQGIQEGFQEVETFESEQSSHSRAIISKLQQEFLPASGGSVQTVSVGVELHGTPTRSYETVLTWIVGTTSAHEGEQPHSFAKLQLTFLENVPEGTLGQPHVTCVKLRVQRPSFLPLTNLQEVFRKNFLTVINGDVYSGLSCEESPVLTIRGSTSVSEEGLRHVRDQVTPEGPGCHGEAVLQSLDVITRPIYDRAHFNITWTQDYSASILNMTYSLDDLLHCALFHHTSTDHTARHPDRLIDIDATKSHTTNEWTVRTARPHEVSVIHGLVIPPALEPFFTPAGPTITGEYDQKGYTSSACVIERAQVRTFDGLVLPFEPSNCWVTVAMHITDQSQGIDFFEGILQVRFIEEWNVRIIWPSKGLVMDLSRSHLQVNGVEYHGVDDDFQVHRTHDSILISFLYGSAVRVSDTVEILEANVLRSKTMGLCSNMDGETYSEMVGPLGCIFTDPALYALAWTTPGDACNSFSLTRAKSKVEAFRETCHRRTFVPTGVSHPNVAYDCTEWTYQARAFNNHLCKALVPTPVCKPGYKEVELLTEPIEYDCEVLVRYHQEAVVPKKCYSHTLATTYPSSCVPHYG